LARQNALAAYKTVSEMLNAIFTQLNSGAIRTDMAKKLVDSATGILKDIEPQPESAEARITLLVSLSDLYSKTGAREEALARAEQAVLLARQLADKEPDNEMWQRLLIAGQFRVGDLASGNKSFSAYKQAYDVAKKLADKPGATDARRQAVAFIANK